MSLDKDNEIEIYKTLVQQRNYEGVLLWTRNQAFLIVNSLSIGILGAFEKTSQTSDEGTIIIESLISLIGMIISITWIVAIGRSQVYDNYWGIVLRDLEQKYNYPPIFGDIPNYLAREGWLARTFKISYLAKFIAVSFFITWTLLASYFVFEKLIPYQSII
jgi:hypothetical protein